MTYSKDDLAWYAREYADTPWMVHIQGPDDCVTHRDEDATVPLTRKDAEDLALAVNTFTVSETENSEYAPHMHATVFHHGVPVEPLSGGFDEQVHVTFGPMKPGQGKSQATAEMACGFELADGSVAYYGVGGAE